LRRGLDKLISGEACLKTKVDPWSYVLYCCVCGCTLSGSFEEAADLSLKHSHGQQAYPVGPFVSILDFHEFNHRFDYLEDEKWSFDLIWWDLEMRGQIPSWNNRLAKQVIAQNQVRPMTMVSTEQSAEKK